MQYSVAPFTPSYIPQLSLASNMNFNDYSSPLSHLCFSTNYFSKLTLGETAELQYPTIAPPGAVTSQKFLTKELDGEVATSVLPLDVIPSIWDLLPTTSTMESAYKHGMRSVLVEFCTDGNQYSHCYHFSKVYTCTKVVHTKPHSNTLLPQIRLIILICNHKKHVESAHDLISHLSSSHFLDITSAVAELRRTPILSTICGLSTNDVPLWRLATLLDERWMDEDVFNAIVELSYFKHQATISPFPHDPTIPVCLFLPTSFLSDARRHYQSERQQYTTEILDLRQCLLLTAIRSISITSIFKNHYTAYVYHIGSTIVDHGDSLHQPPADDIVDIISWVIVGLGHPPIETISSGTISKQGNFHGRDGSCGIAALNFIECYADNNLCQWQGLDSHHFRDLALQNLIRYHNSAHMVKFSEVVRHMVVCVSLSQTGTAASSDLASGYIDFNMYLPLVS